MSDKRKAFAPPDPVAVGEQGELRPTDRFSIELNFNPQHSLMNDEIEDLYHIFLDRCEELEISTGKYSTLPLESIDELVRFVCFSEE